MVIGGLVDCPAASVTLEELALTVKSGVSTLTVWAADLLAVKLASPVYDA
jgi:hypothetical protein